MKIGILTTVNSFSVGPAQLAAKTEELGFESLWFPDHPVIPVRTATPMPESRPGEGDVPDVYSHLGDPLIGLAMAAAVTTRLKLGTGVCLVPERNPIMTAKEVASLDAFSGGRFLFGIGAGWLREESEMLGVDFPHRWSQTREYIAAMRELWTKEQAAFAGKYVSFPAVRLNPKPAQKPGPPVLIGSKATQALRWVASWGDGWCPIFLSPREMKSQLERLRAECAAAGSDYARLDITLMRRELKGDAAQVRAGLELYAEAGVQRIVLMLVGESLTAVNYVAKLKRLAAIYLDRAER